MSRRMPAKKTVKNQTNRLDGSSIRSHHLSGRVWPGPDGSSLRG